MRDHSHHAATERLALRYEGVDIELRCADAGMRRWIREFLVPYFEVVDDATPSHRVDVVIDEARYAALSFGGSPCHGRSTRTALVRASPPLTGPARRLLSPLQGKCTCTICGNGLSWLCR